MKTSILSKLDMVCKTNCPSRWCCNIHVDQFPPPPLTEEEIGRIKKQTGNSDFYTSEQNYPVLKSKPNGRCFFFDEKDKHCSIYDIRPLDCRMFPFDYDCSDQDRKTASWYIWDCEYTRQLNDKYIETVLSILEEKYMDSFIRLWNYPNPKICLEKPKDFRILRPMRIPQSYRNNLFDKQQ